jgi:hypothetical protein
MLHCRDSVFIPTRSAEVVAVAKVANAIRDDDVFYFHLRMKGFVRPDALEISTMVRALEANDSLPFGVRGQQFVWISLLPSALDTARAALRSSTQINWTLVVDELIKNTQFEKDVFWRVVSVAQAPQKGNQGDVIALVDRNTNLPVHPDNWQRDYPLYETDRYILTVQTHSPSAHGNEIPGGSTIALTSMDDEQGLIKLSAQPIRIVPNEQASQSFSVDNNASLDTRYAAIALETQVPDHTSPYPAGSTCTLTVSIRKKTWKLVLYILLVLAGLGLGSYTAAAKMDAVSTALCGVLSVVLLAYGGLLLTRQLKLVKSS